jgi:hypothetical protein
MVDYSQAERRVVEKYIERLDPRADHSGRLTINQLDETGARRMAALWIEGLASVGYESRVVSSTSEHDRWVTVIDYRKTAKRAES